MLNKINSMPHHLIAFANGLKLWFRCRKPAITSKKIGKWKNKYKLLIR